MRRTVLIAVVALLSPWGALAQERRPDAPTARAELKNAEGKPVGGATFEPTARGVLIRASLTGLPAGTHAIHIHEVGRCDPPKFESAGGHFNPTGRKHGLLDPDGPHAGDLPNLHVPESGRLTVEMLAPHATLGSGKADLLAGKGTALVVHAGADDYRTDPAGNAGDRIACGVVGR